MLSHSVFNPASPQGDAIARLFIFIMLVSLAIILLIVGVLAYTSVRYRRRPGQGEPPQTFGRVRLEVVWTAIPFVLLVAVFGVTVRTALIAAPGGDPPPGNVSDVVVIGHQWWWEVRYPSGVVTADEIHLPVGKRMFLSLQSADVIHSLWIPQLNGKMDLVPGQTNHMWLEADRPGIYEGACSEFCGGPHAWMLARVIAETPAQFAAWQRGQLRRPAAATGGVVARGARLFQQLTCRSCHAIAGTAARADIGPDLTHVASRQTLASGRLANTSANLALWLRDPQAVKPGNHMPDLQLSPGQLRDLTAYLESLR